MASATNFTILPLGAIIQRFAVNGLNIVQGFPSVADYQSYNSPYFGETIGRVGNRISGAKINNLNGRSYDLTANNGPNTLHGGPKGWGKRMWEGPIKESRSGKEAILFKRVSDDGEEGFPGAVEAKIWYTGGIEKDATGKEVSVLETEYEVKMCGDPAKETGIEETAVGVTNHSYFNLSGNPTIEGTQITLSTNQHLPVDSGAIPKGTIKPYPGITANEPFTLGPEEPSVDHCFIVDSSKSPSSVPLDTRNEPLRLLVSAFHPGSKVHLEVHSTEPAFQFYTGSFIDVPEVNGIPARGARAGFCVEPQRYVNSLNTEEWKSQVRVKRGDVWGARITYRGWMH
ncbi:MAG: hypothetical protein M1821_004179 [Bathelium mastoideum]|nr:MAG: hypothetical protein M1821_004179 [Bathelium mastoideum]KAI9685430.1 MAG: hypothetical protein M1822_004561 [Bathelium mastoideum]